MKIYIKDEYITICQLLKKMNIISSGGQAKFFLKNNDVKINGKRPIGKGSKVLIGSVVWINDELYHIVSEID